MRFTLAWAFPIYALMSVLSAECNRCMRLPVYLMQRPESRSIAVYLQGEQYVNLGPVVVRLTKTRYRLKGLVQHFAETS